MRSKVVLVMASQALSAFIAYGSLLVTGRFFDPAAYGMVAVAFGLGNLFGVATDLGLSMAHTRQVAMGLERSLALGALTRLRLVLVAAATFLVALVALFAGRPVLSWFGDATTPLVLLGGYVFQLLNILRTLPESTWQAEQRVHLVEGLRTAESLIVLFVLAQAGLAVAALQGAHPPLVGLGRFWVAMLGLRGPVSLEQSALLILSAYVVAKLVTLGLALAWMRKERLRFTSWDADAARSYVRLALPLSITGVLTIALVSTDLVALGLFWDAREAAYYSAAQRLAALVGLAGSSAASVLFPRYAQLHAAGDDEAQGRTGRQAQRYLLLVAAPLVAALCAVPEHALLSTVGPAYRAAAAPLRVLALWALLSTLFHPLNARLMGEGRARVLLTATAVAAVVNLLLLGVLVPPGLVGLGATGAALATFGAVAASYAYARLWSARNHQVVFWDPSMLRVLAAATLTGVAWWGAAAVMPPSWLDHAWKLALLGLAGTGLYGLLLQLVGELTQDDRDTLKRLLHPSSWKPR